MSKLRCSLSSDSSLSLTQSSGWDKGGRGDCGSPKITVAKNILKHILVLEFLKSNEISKFSKFL